MSNTVSLFATHLFLRASQINESQKSGYHHQDTTDEAKRLMAVRCALELIASHGSNEKCHLSIEMDNLSLYADQIQAALEVKNEE